MAKSTKPGRAIFDRPSSALLFLFCIFLAGMGVGAILGKLRPPVPIEAGEIKVEVFPTTDPSTFAVGDRAEIVFTGLEGKGVKSTRVYTVDEKGNIFVPFLGPLEVKGHTPLQTEQAIAHAYQVQKVSSNMPVKVTLIPRNGKSANATQPATRP